MVNVTISVPDDVYAWFAKLADESKVSVQALIERELSRVPASDAADPEFLRAVRATIQSNASLLQRLAE